MGDVFSLATATLMSPPILFFVLGMLAAFARSDLSIPEPIAKGMSLYLMAAIGFKGGKEVAAAGVSGDLVAAALAGMAMSFAMPFLAFAWLRALAKLDGINAGAVAAHYGSISVVTFVTGVEMLNMRGTPPDGYMVAVMALMETPAIVAGLILAQRHLKGGSAPARDRGEVMREVLLNGSVVLLMGAFFIGMLSGPEGAKQLAPLFDAPFRGVLCFFLLDMGLVAARRLREARTLTTPLVGFGLLMPLVGGTAGALIGAVIGLSTGSVAAFAILCASASYIAVPAAIRLTLPQANPGLYLSLSLAVTFPFNITIGIPIYAALASLLTGA